MDATLSLSERETLTRCEQVIEKGLHTFIDVGTALMAIRNSRLYRERYSSFDAYLRDRWPELGSRRAYQLMEAAQVVQNVNHGSQNPGPHYLPKNEKQVRPLAKLPPEDQRSAWERAVETAPNGKVTGEHVQRVVDTMKPRAIPAEVLFPAPQAHADAILAAKYHLLHAALTLLAAEIGEAGSEVPINRDRALEAARLLLDSPLVNGAAAMLVEGT